MSNYPPIQTSTTAYTSTPDLTTEPPANYGELVDYWNKGHETGFFPTSSPAMIQSLTEEIEQLHEQRDENNLTIESFRNALDAERRRCNGLEYNVDKLIERIMELVESGDLEEYVAEELGSIVGRDLIRTVSVRVTADIDIEINVPVGYDLENLEGDLDVEITSIYSSDVEIVNSETSSLSVEV